MEGESEITDYEGQIFADDRVGEYKVNDIQAKADAGNFGPATFFPISALISDNKIPGDSDEEDESPEFAERTNWLTLQRYLNGDYPAILILKLPDSEFLIIDGRHRVVTIKKLIEESGIDMSKSVIKAYVIDPENPQHKEILNQCSV